MGSFVSVRKSNLLYITVLLGLICFSCFSALISKKGPTYGMTTVHCPWQPTTLMFVKFVQRSREASLSSVATIFFQFDSNWSREYGHEQKKLLYRKWNQKSVANYLFHDKWWYSINFRMSLFTSDLATLNVHFVCGTRSGKRTKIKN